MVNRTGQHANGVRAIVWCAVALGLIGLFVGCSATAVDLIQISPATQSLAVGQTAQFTATGIIGHGQHPTTNENVTGMVIWTSSAPAVATISTSGMATAVSPGTTTITASMAGFGGTISSTAAVTVTSSGVAGSAGTDVVSIVVIPGAQSVASPNETTQFIAIGTNSAGATQNMTNEVTWSSSSTQIATIGASTGLATSLSQGTSTITAIFANADKTTATGTATFTVVGGTSEPITALTVTPASQILSVNEQGQFLAVGTSGSSGLQQDVTHSPQLSWTSSIPSIASVNSAGLVTGVSPGTSTITAEWKNPDNSIVSAAATVTVNTTTAPEPLLSLTIIPSSITVGNLQGTGNFMAIGTFSTPPVVRDLTNSVIWLSSEPNSFPVNTNSNPPNPGAPGGIVTAYGTGGAVIIAEATDPTTGSIQTATATFNCPLVLPNPPTTAGSCYPGSQSPGLLATVTVYNEGLNTTDWLVTAPSSTGTPNVIHCGPGWAAGGNPGGTVCVGTYPINTTLTLTAPALPGVSFGGWSQNCTPNPNRSTQAGPNQCTMVLTTTNVSVGAIFN
jgi:uncharacterized protein YjdB